MCRRRAQRSTFVGCSALVLATRRRMSSTLLARAAAAAEVAAARGDGAGRSGASAVPRPKARGSAAPRAAAQGNEDDLVTSGAREPPLHARSASSTSQGGAASRNHPNKQRATGPPAASSTAASTNDAAPIPAAAGSKKRKLGQLSDSAPVFGAYASGGPDAIAVAMHTDDLSSDDEAPRNTIGNVPLEWYKDSEHIGYDLTGKKIIKKGGKDGIDRFLASQDDPHYK
jgi:hypothetical protein